MSEPLTAELVPATSGQPDLFNDLPRLLSLSESELRVLALDVAQRVGGFVREVKRACGLICWAMRSKMSDRDYGAWVNDFASVIGVTSRTLGEWRDQAQKAHGSPAIHTRKRRSDARTEDSSVEPAELPSAPEVVGPHSEAPDPSSPPGATGVGPTTPKSGGVSPTREDGEAVERSATTDSGSCTTPPATPLGRRGNGAQGEPGDAVAGPVHETAAPAGNLRPVARLVLPDVGTVADINEVLVWLNRQPERLFTNLDGMALVVGRRALQKLDKVQEQRDHAVRERPLSRASVEPQWKKAGKR